MTPRNPRSTGLVVLALVVATSLAGCGRLTPRAPACTSTTRLATEAQSVQSASYIACLQQLPQGWSSSSFDPTRGHASFTLSSDRSAGHPVHVELASSCDVSSAIPTTPRGAGVRTYTKLTTVSPRYSGTLFDVFAGGCITYRFDFVRGPHIALMEGLQSAVGLLSRRELQLRLHAQLGVTLDP